MQSQRVQGPHGSVPRELVAESLLQQRQTRGQCVRQILLPRAEQPRHAEHRGQLYGEIHAVLRKDVGACGEQLLGDGAVGG